MLSLLGLLNITHTSTNIRVFASNLRDEVLYEGTRWFYDDKLKPYHLRKVLLVRPNHEEKVIEIFLLSEED